MGQTEIASIREYCVVASVDQLLAKISLIDSIIAWEEAEDDQELAMEKEIARKELNVRHKNGEIPEETLTFCVWIHFLLDD